MKMINTFGPVKFEVPARHSSGHETKVIGYALLSRRSRQQIFFNLLSTRHWTRSWGWSSEKVRHHCCPWATWSLGEEKGIKQVIT